MAKLYGLTESQIARIANAVAVIEAYAGANSTQSATTRTKSEGKKNSQGRRIPTRFRAVITGNTLASGDEGHWTYNFAEIVWTSTAGAYEQKSGGRSGTAISTREVKHQGQTQYRFGVDTEATDFAATAMAARPVGGGGADGTHKVNDLVWVNIEYTTGGDAIYTIDVDGSIDGACS